MKYRYHLWHWTCAEENLFDMDSAALEWYTLFVAEAFKYFARPPWKRK